MGRLVLIISLFFSFVLYGQDKIFVYSYDEFGNRSITYTTVIEKRGETYVEYNVDEFGVRSITPSKQYVVDSINNNIKVYNFNNNGVRSFTPSLKFEFNNKNLKFNEQFKTEIYRRRVGGTN